MRGTKILVWYYSDILQTACALLTWVNTLSTKRMILKKQIAFTLLCALFLGTGMGGCARPAQPAQAYAQTWPVRAGETLTFVMPAGQVHFVGMPEGPVEISGDLPGNLLVVRTTDGLEIEVESRRSFFRKQVPNLEVKVPAGVFLDVSTYEAGITLDHLQGQVKAVSVAGDVLARQLSGDILLKSGRGDVRAAECQGVVRVLGEHGVLDMEDVHGKVSSATIMGTIDFAGLVLAEDEVFLETDHGPVRVTLKKPINVQVKAWTASGEVACMVAGLQQTVDGCEGRVGEGVPGQLTIKTVSGEVWLKGTP